MTTGALDGIRVLKAGLLVQGPQAAALLAQLGATVTKVELPGLGDQARWLPMSTTELRSAFFLGCNRGKRSVTIDMRTPAGRDVFLRLAEQADVVITNFKAGTMEAWGLGYEDLRAATPASCTPAARRSARRAPTPTARVPTSRRRRRAG